MSAGGVFAGTNAVSIKALLGDSDGKLVVPRFQRNYAWDKDDNVASMWNDLLNNFQIYRRGRDEQNIQLKEEAQYLFGPIVLVEDKLGSSKKYLVVDGQQRLVTITILLCTIRDVLAELSTDGRDVKILNTIDDMIKIKHSHDNPWRLEANAINRDVLKFIQQTDPNEVSTMQDTCNEKNKYNYISDQLKKKSTSDSNRKIYEAYQYLYDRIKEAIHNNFLFLPTKHLNESKQSNVANLDKIDELGEFLEHVIRNNYVVQIILPNESTAYLVFESFNSKNHALAKSDLIKNHILRIVGTANSDLQSALGTQWDHVFDKLVKEDDHDRFVTESLRSRLDLRGSMPISDRYPVTDKHLYKIIKDGINEKNLSRDDACRNFVANLEVDAKFLDKLSKPNDYPYSKTKEEIRMLNLFKAKFVRFVALAAHRRWAESKDHDSYTKVLQYTLKFFFKYRVVGKGHPAHLEAIMIDLARMINTEQTLDDILSYIRQKDDHDDFKSRFKQLMKKPTNKLAKYILYQFNHELSSDSDDVKAIDNLTLEHILPRNHSAHWNENKFFEGDSNNERIHDYVGRLGNLTLLNKKVNPSIRDKIFVEKKHAYENSKLTINEETVCNETSWTAATIRRREDLFMKLADKIWSFDYD